MHRCKGKVMLLLVEDDKYFTIVEEELFIMMYLATFPSYKPWLVNFSTIHCGFQGCLKTSSFIFLSTMALLITFSNLHQLNAWVYQSLIVSILGWLLVVGLFWFVNFVASFPCSSCGASLSSGSISLGHRRPWCDSWVFLGFSYCARLFMITQC